jgi:dynein light chain LC8-type
MAERKAVIKSADMSEDMQQDAVDCASQALEKYNVEKVSLLGCCHLSDPS